MFFNSRPPAAEWAAALGLSRCGTQFQGPCPLCGGKDRFHAHDRPDRPGIVGCRRCGGPAFYRRALLAAFSPDDAPQEPHRSPALRRVRLQAPVPRPLPATRHDPRTVAIAQACLRLASEVPDTIARRWRCGLLREASDHGLGWLSPHDLAEATGRHLSASGGLVAPLGRPAVAVQVIMVRDDGSSPGKPDKLTYGPARARGLRVGPSASTLHVAEGVADAIAVSVITGRAAVAAVGTAGLRTIPLTIAAYWPDVCRRMVLVPDGGDPEAVEAARRTVREIEEMLVREQRWSDLSVSLDDQWAPDPAAVWESEQSALR